MKKRPPFTLSKYNPVSGGVEMYEDGTLVAQFYGTQKKAEHLATKVKRILTPIKPRSAKNKGGTLQIWVAKQISKLTGYEYGKDKPIQSREMGQSGTDVRLESHVRQVFPFAIECKNQEQWSVHTWIAQAEANCCESLPFWLLFIKKNGVKPLVVLDGVLFFNLMKMVSGITLRRMYDR